MLLKEGAGLVWVVGGSGRGGVCVYAYFCNNVHILVRTARRVRLAADLVGFCKLRTLTLSCKGIKP